MEPDGLEKYKQKTEEYIIIEPEELNCPIVIDKSFEDTLDQIILDVKKMGMFRRLILDY